MKKYIETDPVESESFSGFYFTPTSDKIVISPFGEVIGIEHGHKLNLFEATDKTPYPSIYVPHLGNRSLHRLLGEAFLTCPGAFEDYQVNHKDGDKTNYRLNNLEWATPSEDIIHAFKTGLRTDNNNVLVKDLISGDVVEYYSQAECARVLKTKPAYIHHFLKRSRKTKPFLGQYDIKRKGGDWNNLDESDVDHGIIAELALIVTVDKTSGLLTLYQDIANLAVDLEIDENLANKWLDSEASCPEKNLIVRRFVDHRRMLSAQSKRRFKNDPTPISVTNLDTGEVTEYLSVQAFSETVDVHRKTIQSGMNRKKGIWRNYYIKYLKK